MTDVYTPTLSAWSPEKSHCTEQSVSCSTSYSPSTHADARRSVPTHSSYDPFESTHNKHCLEKATEQQQQQQQLFHGEVVSFDTVKQFGFIDSRHDRFRHKHIFFHTNDMIERFDVSTICKGQRMTFEVGPNIKGKNGGWKALCIRRILTPDPHVKQDSAHHHSETGHRSYPVDYQHRQQILQTPLPLTQKRKIREHDEWDFMHSSRRLPRGNLPLPPPPPPSRFGPQCVKSTYLPLQTTVKAPVSHSLRYRATIEVWHDAHGYGQVCLRDVPEQTRLLIQNHHLLLAGGDTHNVDLCPGQWVDVLLDPQTRQVVQVTGPHATPLSVRPSVVFAMQPVSITAITPEQCQPATSSISCSTSQRAPHTDLGSMDIMQRLRNLQAMIHVSAQPSVTTVTKDVAPALESKFPAMACNAITSQASATAPSASPSLSIDAITAWLASRP